MHLESELGCWFSQRTRTELRLLLRRYCEGGGFRKAEKGALSRGGYGSYKAVANEFQAELMVPSWHRLLALQKCCRTEVSVFVVFQLCYIIVKFISPKLLTKLKMKVIYGIFQCMFELMPAFCLLCATKRLHKDLAFKLFATQEGCPWRCKLIWIEQIIHTGDGSKTTTSVYSETERVHTWNQQDGIRKTWECRRKTSWQTEVKQWKTKFF